MISINIELKPVQVVFRENGIIVHLPIWYEMIIKKVEVIAAADLASQHYGIATKDDILYILLSPKDTEKSPVHISVENNQIEHISPKEQ